MTPEQVAIIKLSFVRVVDIKEKAGKLFYERLFEIAPETRAMFRGDIDAQAQKLMDSLATAISALRNGPALAVLLDGLGRRHAAYGVKDEHYEKVGEALIWTLEQGLGESFTPETRAAWLALYGSVSNAMKQVARNEATRATA